MKAGLRGGEAQAARRLRRQTESYLIGGEGAARSSSAPGDRGHFDMLNLIGFLSRKRKISRIWNARTDGSRRVVNKALYCLTLFVDTNTEGWHLIV